MRRILLSSGVLLATVTLANADGLSARGNYVLHCSGCHGMNGQGTLAGGIPPFPDSVGHIAGIDIGRTYIVHVPGVVSTSMTDAEIAEVINYVLDAWGDGARHFSAEEVTSRRALPVGDVVAYRREVVEALSKAGIAIADYPWP